MAAESARVIDVEEMDESIGDLAERVARTSQRIVLRRRGIPLAVMTPIVSGDAENDDDAARRRDEALLHEVSDLFSDVSLDELEREIDAALSAVRAQRA